MMLYQADLSPLDASGNRQKGWMMRAGFIGLGNVGSKLAGNLARQNGGLHVYDIDQERVRSLEGMGGRGTGSPAELASKCDIIITCLPSPEVSSRVMEGEGGILAGFGPGKIWCEMSTTDEIELKRLAKLVEEHGGDAADSPVSGGCHRAATGNISIFTGCSRPVFERLFPVLSIMGGRILHTGPLGSATVLKVVTNYLASANLAAVCEALVVTRMVGLDLATAYEAIRISSGNSFVHETESQVILNGSRNINFTMDLVVKDTSLFQEIADRNDVRLEVSPVLVTLFRKALDRYGPREWSPNVIRLFEDQCGISVQAPGFPDELLDDSKCNTGVEVKPHIA